jgi:predicted amidophosphoribosyltransferase
VSAQPSPPPTAPAVCPLCGTSVATTANRCESCGLTLAGLDGRPGPFSRATFWWFAAALLAIYLVVLVVVVLVPE